MKDLLDIVDLSAEELKEILRWSEELPVVPFLRDRTIAALFEKPSNRTRNSTEAAAARLGGQAVSIFDQEVGIDVRERAEDVARTLACYHRAVLARVRSHDTLRRMSSALVSSDVPVVNLLSDHSHPCQAIADVRTILDRFGTLENTPVVFVGDANNVARSLGEAVLLLGGEFRIASPEGYQFEGEELDRLGGLGGTLFATSDPYEAAAGAKVLYTDVWVSMGQESEASTRRQAFSHFQINDALVEASSDDVVVMHCLPAHRGEEITDSVLESERSLVWSQAGHRMSAMIGLLSFFGARGGWLD
ncbi:MAG: ornithine carbamoyltransferase [Acidimicrobiales bacterium]